MNKNKDASSFFLWEDSGDSEMDTLLSHSYELESNVDDDQDDARSCSCDDYASELRALDFQDDGDGDGDLVVGLIDDRRSDQLDGRCRSGAGLEYNSNEEEEEEEEASSNNMGVIQNMNEMEDRVFWDTCMAGGYP